MPELVQVARFLRAVEVVGTTSDTEATLFRIKSSNGTVLFSVASDGTLTGTFPAGAAAAPVVTTVTGATTLSDSNDYVIANAAGGAFTVTLPTAVGRTGKGFVVKRLNSGANNVTVGTTSSQTIDGATTRVLTSQYELVGVISDGSNWHVM
jgi:hypothetical protein